MKGKLAYCGLMCDSCPIHLATLEKDKDRQYEMRTTIANQCFSQYGLFLQPDDITDCDGCTLATGRLFSGCLLCEVRKCASQRNIEGCANCPAYICDKLRLQFLVDPEA